MAKKLFNFEEMENVPIVQTANEVMIKAFEQPAQVEDKANDVPTEEDVVETTQEEIISEPKKKEQKTVKQKVFGEDVRKGWEAFEKKYPKDSYCRNLQLQMPVEMHNRIDMLKMKLDLASETRLAKKNICFVAIEKFLQEHGV